ncbi:MAG: hypothetical protein DRP94_05645 [Candidatus Latescibacterota bacterium]|nr:MAG: hypothetical protein DRP94_05645 [Candidatus Latescibacterota bacterium]HDH99672.1 hypothetical protein [Bacillota bacterium]
MGTAGLSFKKHGRPIVDLGPEGLSTVCSCAFRDGDEYKLWYSGYDGKTWRIGLATSRVGSRKPWHPSGER